MQALLQEYFTASLIYERLHKQVTKELEPYGLTPQQAVVLAVLQEEPMNCSEVAQAMNISLPMVTTLTKLLQRSGHITKKPRKSNKKFRVLSITDKGGAVLAENGA